MTALARVGFFSSYIGHDKSYKRENLRFFLAFVIRCTANATLTTTTEQPTTQMCADKDWDVEVLAFLLDSFICLFPVRDACTSLGGCAADAACGSCYTDPSTATNSSTYYSSRYNTYRYNKRTANQITADGEMETVMK